MECPTRIAGTVVCDFVWQEKITIRVWDYSQREVVGTWTLYIHHKAFLKYANGSEVPYGLRIR